jgi:hypothetical protein
MSPLAARSGPPWLPPWPWAGGELTRDLFFRSPEVDVRESRVVERPAQNEVGAFYWTVLAPDIVNSWREEQGSVSV